MTSVIKEKSTMEVDSINDLRCMCEIKWFKSHHGYGFARCDKIPDRDIFLHFSVLSGIIAPDEIFSGDKLECDISEGGQGPQITEVHQYFKRQEEETEEVFLCGHVKWFNVERDF